MVHQDGAAPHHNIAYQSEGNIKTGNSKQRGDQIIKLSIQCIQYEITGRVKACREETHNASVCGQVATLKKVKLEKGKGSA